MKNTPLIVIGIVVAAIAIGLFSTLFTISEREQALVTRLGEPRRVVTEAGLQVKMPFIEDVVRFDKRVLDFDARAEEVPTKDQKQVLVDAFARYQIVDPLAFYKAVANEFGMEQRLSRIINAQLRAVFGDAELATLLTPDRAKLIQTISERTAAQATEFGVKVLDVRIRRLDLPQENSLAIFRRMQSQREQEARRIRAEGAADAQRIRTDAERRATIVRAEAQRAGQILRGEGEGEAQRTYNTAYGKDPDFYFFWDSMRSMLEGLKSDTTSYVGSPDGDFFRFFGDIAGQGAGAPAAAPVEPRR
jgi:modulator of FtsH protease HflC